MQTEWYSKFSMKSDRWRKSPSVSKSGGVSMSGGCCIEFRQRFTID
jgi:hypothetical protein